MLDTQKQYLFSLYKQHSIQYIDSNFSQNIAAVMGKSDYAELKDDKEFNNYNLLLKNCRSELEKISVCSDQKLQLCSVIDTLARLKNQVSENEYHIYLDFFKETIYPKWSTIFQQCFEFAVDELIGRRHVFISYTNRNAKLNNSFYRSIIDKFLPSSSLTETNLDTKNLIVWVIKQQLIDVNQLTGYFDQDKNDYEYGSNLPETLQKFCADSITFLQFIEKKTFDKATSTQKNYCFEEFTFFTSASAIIKQALQNLIPGDNYFIVRSLTAMPDPDAVYPINFPPEYNDWKNVIHPILYFKLYSKISESEFLCEVEKIAASIKKKI